MHNSDRHRQTNIIIHMLNFATRRQKHLLALSLLLAAGFYAGIVLWAGHEDVLRTMNELSVGDWCLLLLCSMGNYLLRFLRWHLYAHTLGCVLHKGLHFLYYLAGFALTTTPGKAGELLRSVYLKQHGLAYPKSIAMFVTERFLDVLIIACLATLMVFQFGDYGQFVILATAIIIALLLLVKSPLFRYLLIFLHAKLQVKRLQILIGHLLGLLQTSQQLLNLKLLSISLILGFIAWAIQGLAFYYILQRLGLEIQPVSAMGIYAISLLAGAATFVPGGVGGTEVVMGLLLAASGADTGIAVAAPLISRLSTLWFAVGVGFIANALISRQTLKPGH